ncbi:hypothetical protein B0A48_11448 [Cryoendolithus antarcticus]|uniref:Mediator complex subunit 15 KIX domain-containing protein n=1 Tax=Cryoendolithus antarcticus TaxID=1507870 RepID=A0A1V8SVL7_9PEZI|nr:hypothetical protein B0A48_11448 [Cryoendolithus antarcticus]
MEQIKMMPNGMPGQGQGMNTMQQPQPGNQQQQLYAKIMHDLKIGLPEFQGSWQSTFDIAQRANRTMQLITQLRQLEPIITKCLSTAQNFEIQTVRSSPNKEMYMQQIQKKLNDIHIRRQQNAASQNMLPQPQQVPQQMNINPANLNMGINGNGNNMMGNGNMNNGFPMNAPMQNVNMQQLQQLGSDTMNPQNLMAPSMQQQNSQNAETQQNIMQNGIGMNLQQQLQPPTQQQIFALAQRWFQSMGDQKRLELRMQATRNLNDQQRQQAQASGQDPAMHLLVNKARNDLFKQHQMKLQMMQQGMAGQGVAGGSLQQNQMGMPGGQDFDFSSIMAKQASALEMQKSGEQVVPASNNANLPFVNPQQMNASNLQGGDNGINPAMLNANNGNAMSQPQANLSKEQQINLQMIAMEKQRQDRQQQLRMQSAIQQQQQALQQAAMHNHTNSLATPNALTGPAGGSPAMPMLNRPMQPAGGPPTGTPQQPNRAANMNQTAQANQQNLQANNVNALLQHHQMMNRNNAQGLQNGPPGNTQQPRPPTNVVELMATLDPGAQAKLQQMPRDQMAQFLRMYAAQKFGNPPQNARNNMSNMGGVQGQNGQVTLNGMANGMQQMGMPQKAAGQGLPQLPPGMTQAELQARMLQQQQHMQQQQQLRQQQLQQQQQQRQQPQDQQQPANNSGQMNPAQKQQRAQYTAMMVRPFPQDVLAPQALNLSSIPPNVTTWGGLRQHLHQNQNVLQPGIMQKFNQLLQSWFRSKPEEVQLGLQALQNAHNNQLQQIQGQNNMSGQGGAPNANGGHSGGAPTAQMTQPPQVSQAQRPEQQQQQQQLPPNMRPGQLSAQVPMPPNKPITDAEVAMFRERFPPAQNWPVEQAKAMIDKRKREAWAQKTQNLRNANAGGPNATQMQNRVQMANGMHANGQQQPPQQQQQVPGKRPSAQVPQSAASDDVMEIPNPNAAVLGGPKATPKQQQYAFVPQPGKDMKPEDKDSVERRMATLRQVNQGLSDNVQSSVGQQPHPNSVRPGTIKMPTQAQNDSLKALLSQATEAELANVKRLLAEGRRETKKSNAVNLNATDTENARQMLRSIYKPFQQVDTTFPFALKFPRFSPDRIKEIIRAKFQVFYNWEENTDDIKDYLSLSLQELVGYRQLLMTYLNDMKNLKAQAKAAGESLQRAQSQEQLQQQQSQLPLPTAAAIKPPPNQTTPGAPPVSKHNRKASHNKAPAAPTEYKTFDFGSPNPHGIPKYDQSGNQLTPDKLKMPPSKRRKTGQPDSPATTPAAQVGTPASDGIKTSSPEAMRKAQQQAPPAVAEPQRRWRCEHGDCPASIEGFENEDGLKRHVESEHAVIEDPLQFLLDSAALSLGVDSEGNALPVRQMAATVPRPIKQETGTPNGLGISAGTPQGAGSNRATVKREAGSKTPALIAAPERIKTLREVMAEKAGYTLPPTPAAVPMPTPAVRENTSLWADLAPALSPPAFLDDFDSLTVEDWHFHLRDLGKETGIPRSPDTTPGSSSRASDVSVNDMLKINFEWDAFGNGDTAVPEGLGAGLESLGLGDGEAEGEEGMWDWNSGNERAGGPSWEDLFGNEMVQ